MRHPRPLLLLPLLLLVAVACSRAPEPEATATSGDVGSTTPGAADPPGAKAAVPEPAESPVAVRIEDLVRADDTLASVRARLGADAAIPEELPGAEGDIASGWILFPADPARRLSVYLDDRGEHPLMLLAGIDSTAWTRADGVRIGMTSGELAALNGGPFGFMGFDWDYGGAVTDWRDGRLAPDGASAGPVTLCPGTAADGEPLEDYPLGDQEFSSDDPRLAAHPAVVCEFGVNIDPPAPPPPPAGR